MVAALVVMVLFTATAQADPWRPVAQSCVSLSSTGGACTVSGSSDGLWKVVVAPGGVHAYGVAYDSQALMIFDRNPSTGALTQRAGAAGCLSESGSGCTLARGLVAVNSVVISPDGANLYVAAGAGGSATLAGSLAVFDRNPEHGRAHAEARLARAASRSTGSTAAPRASAPRRAA